MAVEKLEPLSSLRPPKHGDLPSVDFYIASLPAERRRRVVLSPAVCHSLHATPARLVELAGTLESLEIRDQPFQSAVNESGVWERLVGLRDLSLASLRIEDLPTSFGRMHFLRRLSVTRTRLQVFPSAVCTLDTLEELDLSSNLLREVSADIARMRALRVFRAADNALTEFPPIFGLDKLEEVDLFRNRISGRIPDEIRCLENLRTLILTGNKVSVCDAVAELAHLETLHLGQGVLAQFPTQLFSLPALQVLDLTGAGIGRMAPGVERLESLRVLRLSSNFLEAFPPGLHELREIRELTLRGNTIMRLPCGISGRPGAGSKDPPPAPKVPSGNKMRQAREIVAEEARLIRSRRTGGTVGSGSAGSEAFDESLSKQALGTAGGRLRAPTTNHGPCALSIADRRLARALVKRAGSAFVVAWVAERIMALDEPWGLLTHLDLSHCSLHAIDYVRALPFLRVLYLNNNNLTSLPPGIGKLSALETLDVSHNALAELPKTLGFLFSLRTLRLHGRGQRVTDLPVEICALKNCLRTLTVPRSLTSPPAEVAARGIDAVVEHFVETARSRHERLRTTRLRRVERERMERLKSIKPELQWWQLSLSRHRDTAEEEAEEAEAATAEAAKAAAGTNSTAENNPAEAGEGVDDVTAKGAGRRAADGRVLRHHRTKTAESLAEREGDLQMGAHRSAAELAMAARFENRHALAKGTGLPFSTDSSEAPEVPVAATPRMRVQLRRGSGDGATRTGPQAARALMRRATHTDAMQAVAPEALQQERAEMLTRLTLERWSEGGSGVASSKSRSGSFFAHAGASVG